MSQTNNFNWNDDSVKEFLTWITNQKQTTTFSKAFDLFKKSKQPKKKRPLKKEYTKDDLERAFNSGMMRDINNPDGSILVYPDGKKTKFYPRKYLSFAHYFRLYYHKTKAKHK